MVTMGSCGPLVPVKDMVAEVRGKRVLYFAPGGGRLPGAQVTKMPKGDYGIFRCESGCCVRYRRFEDRKPAPDGECPDIVSFLVYRRFEDGGKV